MVMEFVPGITLQRRIEQNGKMSYDDAVNVMGQLSEAVAYIHKIHILHRDIKPDNIIITPDNRVVLIDFGSAREFVHDQTQRHTAILTYGYAPIEQYTALSRKGNYTDIYAMGGVFYFILTGTRPKEATLRAMETMPSPKDLNPSIPDKVSHTIMKAMAFKPEDRYQSVETFMTDLLSQVNASSASTPKPFASPVSKQSSSSVPPPSMPSNGGSSVKPSASTSAKGGGSSEFWDGLWYALFYILFFGVVSGNVWHLRTKAFDYVTEDLLSINLRKKVVYTEGFIGQDFKMRLVTGGEFVMGASDDDLEAKDCEKPAHKVTVDSYYIAEAEVSQKLWESVMGYNPSKHVGRKYPVDCVSWEECVEFCNKLSEETGRHFRLPTETEWEFAARGGNKSKNYKFSGGDELNKVAWNFDNSDNSVHKIRKKRSNELGLYDMTGNAWEICNDWYGPYTNEYVYNPQGPVNSEKGRVCRGGGWNDESNDCRVSYRYYAPQGQGNECTSFRVVMDLPVKERKERFLFGVIGDFLRPYIEK